VKFIFHIVLVLFRLWVSLLVVWLKISLMKNLYSLRRFYHVL
jgi:hypothetical protein